jgi:hypothetical protein
MDENEVGTVEKDHTGVSKLYRASFWEVNRVSHTIHT